jgi:hypothetical protein
MSSHDPLSTLAGLTGADVANADPDSCAHLLGEAKKVRGWLDSFEAKVSSQLRHLHESAGAASAADEHSRCGGVSSAEGKRKERRSKTLDEAPGFADALSNGEIGAEHVDALANHTAKLDDEIKDQLLDLADDLLDDARRLTPEKFGRSCGDLIRRLEKDHGIERNRRQRQQTFLSRKLNPSTGMTEGRFALHPELANQIFGAIDKEVAAMVHAGERDRVPEFLDRTVDRNQLSAEALGRLVAGGHQQRRPLEADVTFVIDQRTGVTGRLHEHSVCETSDGSPVPPASVRRAMCQGRIVPIIIDTDGQRIDAGRTVRTANRKQRRALRALYRTCAFGECDVPFDRCEIHHIVPWEQGGPTDLQNLIPICSRHHHIVHDFGWQLDLSPDRTLTVRRPSGEVFATAGPDRFNAPSSTGTAGETTREHRRRTAA